MPGALGVAIGIVLGAVGALGISAMQGALGHDARLQAAADKCAGGAGVHVGDDGRSLTFDNKGEKDLTGASIDSVLCVLTELEMPDYVVSQMAQTTAMDGRQTAQWEGLEVSWSYHPDRGLDGVINVTTKG